MRSLTVLVAIIGIAGCATVAVREFDQRYGAPDPKRFDVPMQPVGMSYRKDVQPVLERRCVVCQGCYDAPCQLKLGAWEGLARLSNSARCTHSRETTRTTTSRYLRNPSRS